MKRRLHNYTPWGKPFVLVLTCCWLLLSATARGQQKAQFTDAGSKAIGADEVLDLVFNGVAQSDGGLVLDAWVREPNGDRFLLRGFPNGGGTWLLRFSGKQPGTYGLTTVSSNPQWAGKTFEVQVREASNPLFRGEMSVDTENPKRFVFQDGSPAFPIAFELDWLFALDYGDPELPRTAPLLDTIRANGFNQVVMNVYAYDIGWKKDPELPERYNFSAPAFYPFGGTNEQPDFSSLNYAYFDHLDRVVEMLNAKGISAHLMIYVWNKKVSWPEMYSDADNRYFDHVIRRYQAYPNIIWDISKEALDYGRCDIPYIDERIGRVRDLDAYGRLVTVHDYEYCKVRPEMVDFISIQSWRSGLYHHMLEAAQIHADKPVVNIEHGGYEKGPYLNFQGSYTDPITCLARSYECLFAGVYASYYWQDTSWNAIVYDPWNLPEAEQPHWAYYKTMQELFREYPFQDLRPVDLKITTNGRQEDENTNTSGWALTNGAGTYLYYFEDRVEFSHLIVPEPDSGSVSLKWLNLLTGEYLPDEVRQWAGWMEVATPWGGAPTVLILESHE